MLKIEKLSVTYPDKTKAVNQFTLDIQNGETVGLIGANGAGKTSLLLALVGILPAEGTIVADGILLEKKTIDIIRGRIGLVFQNPDDQLFMPSIYEDIAFGLYSEKINEDKINEDKIRERVENVLKQLGISYLRDRSPLKLSCGEKRMAAIATVLVMAPSIMLFDEPTAFLDPKARRKLINFLKTLNQAKLIASHDLFFVKEVCERVVLIRNGTVTAIGKTEEIINNKELMEEFS
ncbi:MAG: energy-coupling factor ABC transporter ATP-binding protein [Fusobacteriaceae bacterium]|jgi:cobalt/nickel transport system ATP-binding protein|nr:energy-coupling factor ABC transporter ATP-binding protein [Fusobacteriaceae bacterium]